MPGNKKAVVGKGGLAIGQRGVNRILPLFEIPLQLACEGRFILNGHIGERQVADANINTVGKSGARYR